MLLIALAASCAREPLRLVSVMTDAHGVRHYELSDGSAIALDPLEPFTSDRQRDFPDTQETR